MEPEKHYAQRISSTELELGKVKARIMRVSMLRVILFVAGIVGIIWLYPTDSWILWLWACCTFVPFFVLVKIHNRLFYRKAWLEVQKRVNMEELAGLKGDYCCFDRGDGFVDPEHLYSFDLDLFGRRSLFQAVCRTCTCFGKKRLAHWMQAHLKTKAEIECRQEIVKDLSVRADFREQFRITGLVHQGNPDDEENIQSWIQAPCQYVNALWVKLCIWGVPLINSLLLITSLFGLISVQWFGLSFICFVIVSFGIIKRATRIQEDYGKQLKTLNGYARLIALAKKEEWKSEGMNRLMERLDMVGKSPVDALLQLSNELDRLDLRNNQLLYILLEGSIFFQLQQIVRIERWKERYGRYVMDWLEAVGELDALCSLGTFAYNRPHYVYPVLTDTPFCFLASEMGHPLMPEQQCVKNDAAIPSRPYFLIITGANMAGKSTYLRTIGVNYLLACIGAPVCCRSLTLCPSQLVTSLRTSDSLSDNESYFFAELKRLKRIIDLLDEGNELFIILDEILKGTNSADKQKGSFDLIRQFMRLRANGIIATHDLLLGKLEDQFPGYIRNYCFEADITDDELTFSYRLREGVAQNMNACFLMKKMGITIADEKSADDRQKKYGCS